jgi:cytochrome c-type biogenesis protein CcmH
VVIGSLGVVFAPLLRGGGSGQRRASYDMQVHRDQLREVDADLARGVLSEAEADATRIEVSRRLLAAATEETVEAASVAAPDGVTRLAAPALIVAALLGAGGLYALLGAPGLPDQPMAERLAREAEARANRPSQAEAEAIAARAAPPAPPPTVSAEDLGLVTRLETALATRPDDLEGHRLLARSLAALDRWPEARAAQERVVAILGDAAGAGDLVDLAEMRIVAAGGYVSPEAEAALAAALALEPSNPAGRYYSALTLLQGGRPDVAYRIWSGLVAEGPPDAPWITPARAGMAEAAQMAGLPPPAEETPAPGPTAADISDAEAMPPADRQAMIAGMVEEIAPNMLAQKRFILLRSLWLPRLV